MYIFVVCDVIIFVVGIGVLMRRDVIIFVVGIGVLMSRDVIIFVVRIGVLMSRDVIIFVLHLVKAFHLKFEGQRLDPNISKWDVNILEISESRRHLDKASCLHFWEAVDK